ncbi:glycosyltransferase family 39 protein [Streptomyces sp. SPB78]|uniref:glycosyltransferase family 39 protein n=1 Tax=Streptomyces sp. (strain SPB78) TaxID=591157 RepID=UPI001F17C1E1|nr:glycosyltransferase family 39 protein [Streptomyces sp. SPB78]
MGQTVNRRTGTPLDSGSGQADRYGGGSGQQHGYGDGSGQASGYGGGSGQADGYGGGSGQADGYGDGSGQGRGYDGESESTRTMSLFLPSQLRRAADAAAEAAARVPKAVRPAVPREDGPAELPAPRRDRGGWRTSAPVVALPTLLALVMLLPGLGDRQLWRDEHATWWAASLSLHDLSVLTKSIDIVFIPYYLGMHLWIAVFGDSETALRIPGALAMAAAAGLLGLLGRHLFTARVGLVAGLAFAVVPGITRYGQEVRPYAFAVAAVLLSTLLLLRLLERHGFKGWCAYALTVPLIGWSHLASLCVLAAHLALVVRARRAGDRIAGWAWTAAALIGLCLVLPMALAGSGQSGQIAWNNPTLHDLQTYPEQLFGSWAVAVPVLVLAVVGACLVREYVLPFALWTVLPPLLTFATAAQLHLFLPRYLLFTVPAWVLLAAAALGRAGGRLNGEGPRALRTGGLVLGLVAVAGLTLAAQPGLSTARADIAGEPDFRGAAAYLLAHQKKGDALAYGGQFSERRALDYELRDATTRPKDVLVHRTPQELGSYGAQECPRPASCLATTKRLWLVTTAFGDDPYGDMPRANAKAIRAGFRLADTKALHHVRVLLFTRSAAEHPRDDSAADRAVHAS